MRWLSIEWHGWDALAAIGSISATIVALFLPIRMTRHEWARQDRLRQDDAQAAIKRIVDAHHEVCSAVDRILSYQKAAIAMFGSEPVSLVGREAIRRIDLNVRILVDVLSVLQNRQGLSDGALYSSAAALRIGNIISNEASQIMQLWGTQTPNWSSSRQSLINFDTLAEMSKLRSDQVRKYYGLKESETAKKILDKYIPLSEAIINVQTQHGPSPEDSLAGTYY